MNKQVLQIQFLISEEASGVEWVCQFYQNTSSSSISIQFSA